MKKKSERTMEVYKEAGAYARLLSDISAKAVVSMSKVLPAKDVDRFVVLLRKINEYTSKADAQLFTDFPGIGDEGKDVFYGALDSEPRNGLDKEVIQMAKQKAMELFEN